MGAGRLDKARAVVQRDDRALATDKRRDDSTNLGNRATSAALSPAPELLVGRADDPAEAAADRMADRLLGRSSDSGASVSDGGAPVAHRALDAGATGAYGPEGGVATSDLRSAIEGAGAGAPLEGGLARRMERQGGRSLSHVRVHTGGAADELNHRLSSRAFTVGNDVFFARGQYVPATPAGADLIAHEVAHTLQGGPGVARSIVRRNPPRLGRARGGGDMSALARGGLDSAMDSLAESVQQAQAAMPGVTDQVVKEHVDRFGNLIAADLKESDIVTKQLLTMTGFDKKKGAFADRAMDARAKKRSAGMKRFVTRADTSVAKAESTKLTQLSTQATRTQSEDYQRLTLINKAQKRSGEKQKAVKDGTENELIQKGQTIQTDTEGTKYTTKNVASDPKAKAKLDKKQEKLAESSARQIAELVGKDMLSSFSFFKDAVTGFTAKIESVVRTTAGPFLTQRLTDLQKLVSSQIEQAEAVKQGVAAGKMGNEDMLRAAKLTRDRAENIAGDRGFVHQFTQDVSTKAADAAQQTYDVSGREAVGAFEERISQAARRKKANKTPPKTGGNKKHQADDKEYGAFATQMKKRLESAPTAGGLSDVEIDQKAEQAVTVELNDNLHSVFDKIVKMGVPSDQKVGTLGANKSFTAYVKIPLHPPGVLQLEFQVTGSRYPDGNNWVQSRIMIKGGIDSSLPGVKVKALAGLGFYLEAGGRDRDKLGTLLSFALYRRFVESPIVPIELSNYLWGREAKEGVRDGKFTKKTDARYQYAKQWGRMVEESFDDGDYAESGGVIRGEAQAKSDTKVGGQEVGGELSMEYQQGKRYDKDTIAKQRQKHDDKAKAGKYKKGDAEQTGFGKTERNVGTTSHRFTVAGNAAVGPFSAGFSAGWWDHEREWWIDGTLAAGGGSFAGDPAAIAARVATWAGDLVVAGGKIVAQGEEKRRAGKNVDVKDMLALKKVAKPFQEAGGTMKDLVQGSWGASHQQWQQAQDAAPVKRGFAESGNAWNQAGQSYQGNGLVQQPGGRFGDPTGFTQSGANKTMGKLASQTTAFVGTTLGLEKAKAIKLLFRGIVRPGEGRQSEFQFHVLHEKSKDLSLFDFIGVKQSAETPIFYAQLPSKKTIWMGGITLDDAKRAMRHEKEVVQEAHKYAHRLV